MEQIKKNLEKIVSELAEHDKRIIRMEITINGNEGRGGLYDKVEDMNETMKSLQKSYWIGIGALMIIQIIILPLIFKFLI